MKKLIVLFTVILTSVLTIGCLQPIPSVSRSPEVQPSQSGNQTVVTAAIQMTATVNGLAKGEEVTLTVSHEGSNTTGELFFKKSVIGDGEAVTVDIAANLTDGYYQLLIEAPGKYFREPKGYFFMVSKSAVVNTTGREVVFKLLPQPEQPVIESYIPLSAPPRQPPPLPPFQVSVVPDDAHYLPGELIKINFSIINVSSEVFTVDSFPREIDVTPGFDYNNVLFAQTGGTENKEIKPGGNATAEFTWDQKDYTGKQAAPGWYNIRSKEITLKKGNSTYTFTPGTRLLIEYPQSAMEKSFNLNQSQTTDGVKVTLERVVLSANGSSFYFFFIPPGYTAPPNYGYPTPPPPNSLTFSNAEYTIGGITKNADDAGFNTRGDGITLVWGGGGPAKLDPVPNDAKEITFTITQLNDLRGPWVFKVPLQ